MLDIPVEPRSLAVPRVFPCKKYVVLAVIARVMTWNVFFNELIIRSQ